MGDKKLFKDKRWSQSVGGEVIEKKEVSEEDKKEAEELLKKIIENK